MLRHFGGEAGEAGNCSYRARGSGRGGRSRILGVVGRMFPGEELEGV